MPLYLSFIILQPLDDQLFIIKLFHDCGDFGFAIGAFLDDFGEDGHALSEHFLEHLTHTLHAVVQQLHLTLIIHLDLVDKILKTVSIADGLLVFVQHLGVVLVVLLHQPQQGPQLLLVVLHRLLTG